jgi:hypothetical protein
VVTLLVELVLLTKVSQVEMALLPVANQPQVEVVELVL